MRCFIGIDLGSTTTKAVVIDENQHILGRGISNSRSNYDTRGSATRGRSRARGVQQSAAADTSRLEAVEFKIAHLERAVQELSDVLYRQQQQLDAALAMNQRLRQQLEEIEGRSGDATSIEIPPHY